MTTQYSVLSSKKAYLLRKKKTEGNEDSLPAFYYTCGRSCGAGASRRRNKQHKLVSIDAYQYIDMHTKGTHRIKTNGVCGQPRAADLSAVKEGCSPALVGAQLWS